MKYGIRLLFVASAALVLTACSSMDKKDDGTPAETVDRSSGTATDQGSATATGVQQISPVSLQALEDPSSTVYQRVIYFEFDSSTVRSEFLPVLSAHAGLLAANPGVRVRLEGHADERGSREYNLGLGERRSQAVERLLVLNGSGANQLDSVSYGEERPVAFGHDESAWTQNRRVEIIYPDR